ncbi:MAG: amidase [Rhodospirillales bacterium]|nr:amidase [Rhodospirillales bacterium]
MTASRLADLSMIETAAAIAKGEITSEAATRSVLDRLKTIGPKVNCVIAIEEDEAMAAARVADAERAKGQLRGPLHGVPMGHKDLLFRKGKVVTSGAKITRGFVAPTTATVLERLEAAGAIYVAALHLAEFARSPTGHNEHFGPCRNPWNLDHVTGGSSSGSGAAVAARLVPAALGSDTGGSIRLPASICGVVGLMPTQTRVSRAGVMPLSWSMDTVGPMARDARDCARLLSIIAGADPRDLTTSHAPVPDYEKAMPTSLKGLRVGVPRRFYYDPVTPEVGKALDESLRVFRDVGAVITDTDVPDMALIDEVQHIVRECEAATVHGRWLRSRPKDFADQVRSRTEPGLFYTATRYLEALDLRAPIVAEFLAKAFGDNDILHLPGVPIPVPTIAETTTGGPEAIAKMIRLVGHCTRHINFLGLPAIAVPCGFSASGLPIAFQLIGRPFGEATLLGAADRYQAVTDWRRRAPAIATGAA